jgi:hypothetical protein
MYNENGQRLCEVGGCSNKYLAKGVCRKHYERLRRNDSLELNPRTIAETLAEKSEWQGDCLVWTGYLNDAGYGILYRNGKSLRVHRMAWLEAGRELPDDVLLDHRCHNRACFNLKHLRPADSQLNNQNRAGANKNSTTGIRGVSFVKSKGTYKAQVMHNRVQYVKGGFPAAEGAEQAAVQMRLELHGEVAK